MCSGQNEYIGRPTRKLDFTPLLLLLHRCLSGPSYIMRSVAISVAVLVTAGTLVNCDPPKELPTFTVLRSSTSSHNSWTQFAFPYLAH
jgi:hypothetical protein